jgi:hypothetical protein
VFCSYFKDDIPIEEIEFIRLYKTTEAEMHSRREAYGNQKWYTRYWKYVLKDGFFVRIEALCCVGGERKYKLLS